MPNSTEERVRHADTAVGADSREAQVPQKPSEKKIVQPATEDMPDEVVSLARRGDLTLDIRRAEHADLQPVLELINEAKLWLPTRHTNQWSTDWADAQGRKRSDRVQDSIEQKTTWIVTATYEGQPYAVGTVTIENDPNPVVWDRPGDAGASAVYLSRLVVARRFAGLRIGTALLNWACEHARREHRVKKVRIDVWTRNFTLHKYYLNRGFHRAGKCRDESYPSGQRFQRSSRKKTRSVLKINDASFSSYSWGRATRSSLKTAIRRSLASARRRAESDRLNSAGGGERLAA